MLRFLSAGESHGQALVVIVEGMPAHIPLQAGEINLHLSRRQQGYGRGGRMKIEHDQVQILSGVRNGYTLGSPIACMVANRDWVNWQAIMGPQPCHQGQPITRPRPGHADLAGGQKYGHTDLRNILERASARETATRVVAGAIAQALLKQLKVEIYGHVVSIGDVCAPDLSIDEIKQRDTMLNCPCPKTREQMIKSIGKAKAQGDSLGGVFEIRVLGLPPGLGSHVHWDRKLDGQLAGALMSIQGIKGVEVGLGFRAAQLPGSQVHDPIRYGDRYWRTSNNAGGLEGGISNGEPVILRAAMKPIPTLYQPLESVDMVTKETELAVIERSDICAVPAASVVGEAMVAWVVANAFIEKFGGDNLAQIQGAYESYCKDVGHES